MHPSLPRPPHKWGSRSFYEELASCPHVCTGFGKHEIHVATTLMFSPNWHLHKAHFPAQFKFVEFPENCWHACNSPASLWSDGPALQSVHLQLIKPPSLCRPNGRLIHQGSARLLYPLVLMSGPLSVLPTYTQFAMTSCGHRCSSDCPQMARHDQLWLKQILLWKLLVKLIHLQPRCHFSSFSQI